MSADYREKFAKQIAGQAPDALLITCSDSRVVPHHFIPCDPGDLFVVRNVGNLIPPCQADGTAADETSVWAAIEFSILQLNIPNIIVCGHSDCRAMHAILQGRQKTAGDHLQSWLQYGAEASAMLAKLEFPAQSLSEHDKLAQANVLLQLEHLVTHPLIQERLKAGRLQLHGWWFDIASASVYIFDEASKQFECLDAQDNNDD